MFKKHQFGHIEIAEVVSEGFVINTVEDSIDLIGNAYYQGFESLILHVRNITPDLFDLKTKMAGEVLQKFSNYRMRLFIIGDFSNITSNSLKDFVRESNQGRLVNFVSDLKEVEQRLVKEGS